MSRRENLRQGQDYLGGKVMPFDGGGTAGDARPTARDAATILRRNLEKVRKLGGKVEGNVIRVPMQHAGLACVDWLSKNGYRIVRSQ